VVLAAAAQAGRALEYASAELKNDKEVVLAAVAQAGLALVNASAELKNDKEALLGGARTRTRTNTIPDGTEANAAGRRGHASAARAVSVERGGMGKSDKEVALVAVTQDGYALGYASAELRSDRVVLAAVAQAGWALRHASAELRSDRVVLAAVARAGGDAAACLGAAQK
jgi:hypothetical protein